MQVLHVHAASPFASDHAKAQLKQTGTEVKVRAEDEPAKHIDRYGAIIRVCMHLTQQQCNKEGLNTCIQALFDASLFFANALLTVGKATPYQELWGRQPAMLSPILESQGSDDDSRLDARVREIAMSCMVTASTMARSGRSLTDPAVADINPGDLVDFTDDGSNWVGPATVVRLVPANGNII